MEWEVVDHDMIEGLAWFWIPEDQDKILGYVMDNITIDIESGEEVKASHYIVIVEPTGAPVVH